MEQQLLKELRKDNTEKVLELIQGESNLQIKDKKGKSLLHLAIENKNPDILSEIVKVVDPSEFNYALKTGETPLSYCLNFGFSQGIQILLENGVQPDLINEQNLPIIHQAAGVNQIEAIKYLIKYGADINQKVKQGTPLHVAIVNGSVETAIYIIKNAKDFNIDFSVQDDEGNTVLHLCIIEGLGSLFLELIEFIQEENQNQIEDLINTKNQEGNSILHEAYINDRKSVIEYLEKNALKLNLNVDQKNLKGLKAKQIGEKQQQIEEETKEQEIIQRKTIKEETQKRKAQEKKLEQEELERQKQEQQEFEKQKELQQEQYEENQKKTKFITVVLIIVFMMIIYLSLKQVASAPSGGYID